YRTMAMNEPNKTDKQRRSSAAVWLIAIAIVVPALYVLSTGPAAWLSVNDCLPQKLYMAFYYPLDKLSDACPPIGDAIGFYERQWLKLPMRASGRPPEIQKDGVLPMVPQRP